MDTSVMTTPPPDPQKMRRQAYFLGIIALIMSLFGVYLVAAGALPTQYNLKMGEAVSGVTAAEGYEITVFQTDLAAPRFMVGHPTDPVLFVAERGAGRVIALADADGDRINDAITVVIADLAAPTGLAFWEDWLYIAQSNEVIRIRLDEKYQVIERETIITDLPVGRNPNEVESNLHALIIHDGELYLSIGASCAACEESDSRRATVMVYALDGSNERVFARGLYQVLGLATNPITGDLWASNQGRPQLDDPAAETIYHLQNGDDAGFPYCVDGQRPAPEWEEKQTCETSLQPLLSMNPQGNITTLLFLTHTSVPAPYQGDLLVALHGGVVGEGRDGLQVEFGVYRLPIDDQGAIVGEPEFFVSGLWLSEEPGDYLGRPFGLAMTVDGSLFISDDASGAIYQLRPIDVES